MPIPSLSMRIRYWLSLPWVCSFCFIVAIIGKIGLLRVYLGADSDETAHLAMAQNFLNGHGFTISTASLNDLSQTVYASNVGWPPGHNLLLSAILSITGNNYMLATFIADCIAALVFMWYFRKLLLLIRFPAWLINLFLLFQGFFAYDYILFSTPTDFLSAALLIAALYHLLKCIETDSISYKHISGLSFFLLAASFVRYQNIPVAVLTSVFLSVWGLWQKKRSWFIAGLTPAIVLLLSCGALLIFQYYHSGSAYYVVPSKKGFYPENLLHTSPFLIRGNINVELYSMQLSLYTSTTFETIKRIIFWANLILVPLFSVCMLVYLLRKKGRVRNSMDGFLLFGFVLYAGTVAVLAGLSLVLDKHIGIPVFEWTYVMDGRYFSFPVFFFQISLWAWLFLYIPRHKTIVLHWIQRICVLIIAVEILHGGYYLTKKAFRVNYSFAQPIHEDPVQERLISFIKTTQKNDPSRKIVTGCFRGSYGFMSSLHGASSFFNLTLLNDQPPQSTEPAVLLLVLRKKKQVSMLQPFLHKPGVSLLADVDNYNLYTYYIDPPAATHE